jgi:hypothetical protein
VGSARSLSRLIEYHDAYRWLAGGISVNHHTLSDFRLGHGALLDRLLAENVAALCAAGAIDMSTLAQDGVRVRASAGAASFRRRGRLEQHLAAARELVARLKREVDENSDASNRRMRAAKQRAARERAERIAAALATLDEVEAQREERKQTTGKTAEKRKEPRASTTDPQARVMKMADGGFRPAYNVQFASDTRSGAVAGVAVDNSGSDMGKMAPMNEALAKDYGERPRQHLADGGYVKFDDIEALDKAGVDVYAPVPAPRDKSRDRYAPQQDDTPAIAAWRKRMNEEAAKDIYKERAATAECTNAQARNRGLRQFLVRGVDKVKSIALMHGLTHNMVCGWRLIAI